MMESGLPFFKSRIHFLPFLFYSVLLSQLFRIIILLFIENESQLIYSGILISTSIIVYLTSIFTIKNYNFYHQEVQVFYPTRIINRVKSIQYLNVEKVVFQATGDYKSSPKVWIHYTTGRKKIKYYFPISDRVKISFLLKELKRLNINIIIDSFKTDDRKLIE